MLPAGEVREAGAPAGARPRGFQKQQRRQRHLHDLVGVAEEGAGSHEDPRHDRQDRVAEQDSARIEETPEIRGTIGSEPYPRSGRLSRSRSIPIMVARWKPAAVLPRLMSPPLGLAQLYMCRRNVTIVISRPRALVPYFWGSLRRPCSAPCFVRGAAGRSRDRRDWQLLSRTPRT